MVFLLSNFGKLVTSKVQASHPPMILNFLNNQYLESLETYEKKNLIFIIFCFLKDTKIYDFSNFFAAK